MSAKNPSFIVSNGAGSSYFFRSTIPRDLRQILHETRELRISLRTGIKKEARQLARILKFRLDDIFEDIRCGNISTSCVKSIKNQLKLCIHEHRMQEYQMIRGEINSDLDYPRPLPSSTDLSIVSGEIELSAEYRLARDYIKSFKYNDIVMFCEDNDFEYPEGFFPLRHIRRSRENLVKLIDQEVGIDSFAEEIAEKIINSHLTGIDFDRFLGFLKRFNIRVKKIGEFTEESVKADISDLILTIGKHYSLVEIALKLGMKTLINREEDVANESQTPGDSEEQVKLSVKKVWENVLSDEKEPDSDLNDRIELGAEPNSIPHASSAHSEQKPQPKESEPSLSLP